MNRRTAPSSRHTRATGRWRFLADASAALDTSIEYEQTLANTVRLAVPEVADYCVVILVDEEGATRWADSTHRDPAKRALLESLRGFVPPASPDHPIRRALRTGRPQLVTNAGAQILKWWDGTRLSAVRELAPDSTITVPMIARGRTFGAILFAVTAESGRRYGGRDLELATDVGRRAAFAIDHALLYQAAERAAKARDELMAVVAHDLKNPLNTIQLALRALLDSDGSGDDEGGKRALERHALGAIQRAADRMYRLIHDLLDVARADAGRLWIQPAPADPEVLLREALEAHCQVAAAKGVTLEAAADEPLPSVLADRERIAQVFSNLIGNALKFTPGGGRVSVRGWRATPGVRFAVEDTGPGIPRDQQPHVFDRFWQATNAPAMGTGLGLSIAKAIVEGHGGSIKVDSAPGQGTRFEFSLPMAGETSVDAEPGPPGSRPDRPWATACAQPGARPPTSAAQRVGA
ncbi:MAG TPA: GAF domain-containing sensor histidine kinase [Vicinamibacteria bacterium]|nr:GAF domain-containing sensor histidine kinase [Vicinamibacteria bacterium]